MIPSELRSPVVASTDAAALARLRLVLSLGAIGTWDWDAEQDSVTWDANHYLLCGVSSARVTASPALFWQLVHEDDRARVQELLARSREQHHEYALEFRIRRHDDGAVRWLDARGVFFYAGERLLGGTGIIVDITDRREAERALRVGAQRLEYAMEAAQDGLWDWNIPTGDVYFSPRWCQMLGYSPGELTPHFDSWISVVHPDDLAAANTAIQEQLDGKSAYFEIVHRVRHGEGHWLLILHRGKVVERDGEGAPIRLVGLYTDLTRERAARDRLQRLRQVTQVISAAKTMRDVAEATLHAARMQFDAPIGYVTRFAEDQQAFEGLAMHGLDAELYRKFRITANEPGTPSPDCVRANAPIVLTTTQDLLSAYPHFAARRGLPEMGAMCVFPLQVGVGESLRTLGTIALCFTTARGFHDTELDFLRALASVAGEALARARAYEAAQAARRAVEAKQRELEAEVAARATDARKFRLLFDRNPAPMWVYDRNTLQVLAVNEAAIMEYGWSRREFEQLTILELRPEEDVEALRMEAERGFPDTRIRRPSRHRTRDGRIRMVEITSHAIEWEGRDARLVLAQDETERRLLEDRLRQSQKMEAIGQLAGGIAHDFNNLLTVIGGNLEFARSGVAAGQNIRPELDEIGQAASRARALVGQLLAFSRKERVHLQDIDLNELVYHAESMLRRLIGEEIVLQTYRSERPAMIHADRGQVERILLNLAVNARDAMLTALHGHEGRGGTLTLATQIVELSTDEVRRWPQLFPGPYVRLTVTDNGHGMTDETLQRLFEPFYTTKPVGTGTGLGLATVFGLVEQGGGVITVSSRLGEKTEFDVLFPLSPLQAAPIPALPPSRPSRGSGTILLVEDEAAVRLATRRMMERHGYQVIEAEHGAAACALWHGSRDRIRAVVSDVRMPVMGGRDMARAIRAIEPSMPIVFVSGYAADLEAFADTVDRFIEKPFTSDVLLDALDSLLD